MIDKKILEELDSDNLSIEKQTDLLAKFLMENFDNEFGAGEGKGESAVEMAVRLLIKYKESEK